MWCKGPSIFMPNAKSDVLLPGLEDPMHVKSVRFLSLHVEVVEKNGQIYCTPIIEPVSAMGHDRASGLHRACSQMNSLAASVKLTYSASMVDRLTDFCLKVRDEIGVSSIKVMNPPIDTRSSLFVAKPESE
ncbi:hypothetical protein TNCV_4132881 [Trichonephila clavipes]|nr:hypothetical protein TNCV_4132881 [Trichonephila clavipes]